MTENFAKGVRWDLSELYGGPEDPKIAADLQKARVLALEFEKKHKSPLENAAKPGVLNLAALLADYKVLVEILTRLGVFSHLAFAGHTDDPKFGAFLQKMKVELTDIQSHVIFFGVLWNKLDDKTADGLMKNPAVSTDLHYLRQLRVWAPHTLSEGEEKLMAVKSNTSGGAFSRLFDEVMNSIPFYLTVEGRRVKKTEGEVLALLHSSDRTQRKQASDSLAEGLAANTHLLTYIYNMILADHRTDLKIRSYKHPMDPMNLSNEIDRESVLTLVQAVKAAYPLAQRYYRLKKKLLGLETLYDYDRYAPVSGEEAKVPFEECRQIVMDGYRAFSQEASDIIEPFFTKRWIDAEVRPGKQGGGFCCQTTPALHPYILVNYTGTVRDVMTVAHELGHGLHQSLARQAGILESDAPLTMAETASVFGEMLIFEELLSKESDPRKRLGLLCGKIDDNFATVFRQIAMTDFEIQAHEAGIRQGELSADAFSALWLKSNGEYYGDSVVLTDNQKHGWKYIPHFIHSPFYCYAYAFAQLFVLCLYQEYKKDKKGFLPKYLRMLSLGGSKAPHEIAAIAGLDFRKKDFWKGGLTLLEGLVAQAETLAADLR